MSSNAPKAMLTGLKRPSGPPNTVIAKGRDRGKMPTFLFTEVRVFKVYLRGEKLAKCPFLETGGILFREYCFGEKKRTH